MPPNTLRFSTAPAVRRRVAALFPDGVVSGQTLISNIAFGAAVLGAGHVELNEVDDWWFVASEFDWMKPSPPSYGDVTELFTTVVPFPQQSPESHRSEIYVATFAETVYVDRNSSFTHIKGPSLVPPYPHEGKVPPWCVHVLAFRLPDDKRIDFDAL